MVIDVGVAEGSTSDGIATDADRGDGTNGIEDFKEQSLVDIGEEVANVKACILEGVGS